MPEEPNRAANFHGGTSDYWDGLLTAYYLNELEGTFNKDAMEVKHGDGDTSPPPGLRFMEDSHAAGAMVLGGEVING